MNETTDILKEISRRTRQSIENIGRKIGLDEKALDEEIKNEHGMHSEYMTRLEKAIPSVSDRFLVYGNGESLSKEKKLFERATTYSVESIIKDIEKIKSGINDLIKEIELACKFKTNVVLKKGDNYEDRIINIAKNLGISKKELGKSLGYENMGINQDIDKSFGIRGEYIELLKNKYPIVNLHYLITGEGNVTEREERIYDCEKFSQRETIRELRKAKKILNDLEWEMKFIVGPDYIRKRKEDENFYIPSFEDL